MLIANLFRGVFDVTYSPEHQKSSDSALAPQETNLVPLTLLEVALCWYVCLHLFYILMFSSITLLYKTWRLCPISDQFKRDHSSQKAETHELQLYCLCIGMVLMLFP